MIVNILFNNGKYLSFQTNDISPNCFDEFLDDHCEDTTMGINFRTLLDVDYRKLGTLKCSGFCNGGYTLMLCRVDVESINISDI